MSHNKDNRAKARNGEKMNMQLLNLSIATGFVVIAMNSIKGLIRDFDEQNYEAVILYMLSYVVSGLTVIAVKSQTMFDVEIMQNRTIIDLVIITVVLGLSATGSFNSIKDLVKGWFNAKNGGTE